MGRPRIGTREEWQAARDALLVKEKAATRQRDALAAERRALPMVRVEKKYAFVGWTARSSRRTSSPAAAS